MNRQAAVDLSDINAYLRKQEQKDLLRFITCGSVDDGKSTLIGRLLHDTHKIFEDQLSALESDSRKHGTTGDDMDLALLVVAGLVEGKSLRKKIFNKALTIIKYNNKLKITW